MSDTMISVLATQCLAPALSIVLTGTTSLTLAHLLATCLTFPLPWVDTLAAHFCSFHHAMLGRCAFRCFWQFRGVKRQTTFWFVIRDSDSEVKTTCTFCFFFCPGTQILRLKPHPGLWSGTEIKNYILFSDQGLRFRDENYSFWLLLRNTDSAIKTTLWFITLLLHYNQTHWPNNRTHELHQYAFDNS